MENITPKKRLNLIYRILLRGIYLYADKEGWLKDKSEDKDKSSYEEMQIDTSSLK